MSNGTVATDTNATVVMPGPYRFQYFAVKQQHVRQLQLYVDVGRHPIVPIYQVSAKYIMISDGRTSRHIPVFMYHFDCEVEAELSKITPMGTEWVSITVPLELEATDVPRSELLAHDESQDFPTAYEVSLTNLARGIYTRCCGAPLLRSLGLKPDSKPSQLDGTESAASELISPREQADDEKRADETEKSSVQPCPATSTTIPVTNVTSTQTNTADSVAEFTGLHYFPFKLPFKSSFVMPSPYWQELADIWFCHNRKAAVVSGERHNAEATPSRLITGESTLTLHCDDLLVPFDAIIVGSSQPATPGHKHAEVDSTRLIHVEESQKRTTTSQTPETSRAVQEGPKTREDTPDANPESSTLTRLSLEIPESTALEHLGKKHLQPIDSSTSSDVWEKFSVKISPESVLTETERTAVKHISLTGVLGSSLFVSPVPISSKHGPPEYRPSKTGSIGSSTPASAARGPESTSSSDPESASATQTKDSDISQEAAQGASSTSKLKSANLDALRWKAALPLVCSSCSQRRTLGEAQVLLRPVQAHDETSSKEGDSSSDTLEVVILGPVSLFKCMLTNVPPPRFQARFPDYPSQLESSSDTCTGPRRNVSKHQKPLSPTYNVYSPYTLENLAAAILLAAAHAHVSYRFLIIDPGETVVIQLVLSNWDCQVKTSGVPLTHSDEASVDMDNNSEHAGKFAHPDHRAKTQSEMAPAVRLSYRCYEISSHAADAHESKVGVSSVLPREVFGWGFVLGAQQLTWTRDDIRALIKVLDFRSNSLPEPLQTAGAAKGFRQSYLLRTSRLASVQPVIT